MSDTTRQVGSPMQDIEAIKMALGGLLCNRNPGDHCFGLPFPDDTGQNTVELQSNILYFVPFFSFGERFDRFVVTWEAGSATVTPAIYSNNSYFYPQELMYQYPDQTASVALEIVIPSIWLSLGWYWMAINPNSPFDVSGFSYAPIRMIHRAGFLVGGNYFTVAHTHGNALPTTAAAGMNIVTTAAPRIGLRKAA